MTDWKFNRFSALDVTEFCGLAGVLGSQYGAGVAAAKGSAWHAVCSDAPDRDELLARLTPADREDMLANWHKPTTWEPLPGLVLDYAKDCQKELRVSISKVGVFCSPDAPDLATTGTLDMAWFVEFQGMRIAVVGDIKSSLFTSRHDSLQLAGYAGSFASLTDATHVLTAIFGAAEGEWSWGPLMDVYGDEFSDRVMRVLYAAKHHSEHGTQGQHCGSNCYARAHCKEFLLPAALVSANPQIATLADQEELTPARAVELLNMAKGLEEIASAATSRVKAYAEQQGLTCPTTGKRYLPVVTAGRESVTVTNVRKLCSEEVASQLILRGAPYNTWRWVAEKKKP